MSKLIKVKGTSFISRNGKLINRKSYRKLLSSITTLSKAKQRVKVLRNALTKLRELTANDPDKLEYGAIVNKVRKKGKGVVNRGYYYNDKIPTVDLPKGNDKFNWLLHSHPDAIPLSLNDINYPKKGGTVFAVDKDGSIYRATKKGDTQDINDTYHTARKKLKELGYTQTARDIDRMSNPNVSQDVLEEDLGGVVQHKLLTHLHKKGLIHYRAKLSPAMKGKVNRYSEIMNAELKRSKKNMIAFNRALTFVRK